MSVDGGTKSRGVGSRGRREREREGKEGGADFRILKRLGHF